MVSYIAKLQRNLKNRCWSVLGPNSYFGWELKYFGRRPKNTFKGYNTFFYSLINIKLWIFLVDHFIFIVILILMSFRSFSLKCSSFFFLFSLLLFSLYHEKFTLIFIIKLMESSFKIEIKNFRVMIS